MNRPISLMVILTIAVALLACAGASQQQKGTAIGSGVGAGLGAIVGQAIGRNTEGTLIGAGIGAVVGGIAGNQIGAYMDRQERALRDAMAATESAQIRRTQDVLTATFKSEVLFDFDSVAIKPGAYSELNRVAQVLNQYPQTAIRVEGHTDATGTEAYNQQLSEKRAHAVKNGLIQMGVNAGRIAAVGYGESQPISSNNAMNRRVNIVITPIVQG